MRAFAAIALLLVGCGGATPSAQPAGPASMGQERSSRQSAAPSTFDVDGLLESLRDLTARGELDAARARADEALAHFPDRIEALYAGGTVDAATCKARYRDGSLSSRSPDAVAHCERCIQRMTDVIARGGYRHDHYNRGSCHAYLERDADAEADLTAGLATHPDDGDYFAFRGDARRRLGRLREACEDFRSAVRLGVAARDAVDEVCARAP